MMKSYVLAGASAVLALGLGYGALGASDKTPTAADAKSGQSTADKTAAEKPAADKAQQAEPVSAEPESTTASYGDWTLRCQRASTTVAAAAAAKNCEIVADVTVQGQSGTVAEVAIGRLQKDQPYRATVLLPVNVTLTTPGALTVEGTPPTRLELAWARCLPSGCFAGAPLGEADLGHLRDGKAKAALLWQAGTGQGINLPLSLRGFAQAFESLNNTIE